MSANSEGESVIDDDQQKDVPKEDIGEIEKKTSFTSEQKSNDGITDDTFGNEDAPNIGELGLFTVGPVQWIKNLNTLHGAGLIFMIFCMMHMIKGFCKTLSDESQFFLFQDLHVPAAQVQIYNGVISLPWVIKPIFALISDVFPICGFNKLPYMATALLFGVAGALTAGLYASVESCDVCLLVVALFAIQASVAVGDLLTQARYSSSIREHPHSGPNLLSYVWIGIKILSLVALGCAGLILENWSPRISYLVLSVPVGLCLIPVCMNLLGESRVTKAEAAASRRVVLIDNRPLVFLCLLVLAVSIGLLLVGVIVKESLGHLIMASVTFVLLEAAYAILLRPIIAQIMMFLLIQGTCPLHINSATYYFYTDSVEAYPEGPHFSRAFATLGLGSIAVVCSILALLTYNKFLRKLKYRPLLMVTTILLCLFNSLDSILFLRLNVEWGIPDLAWVIVTAILKDFTLCLTFTPSVVLYSHLGVHGVEAILFSLFAGAINAGGSLADFFGSYMLDKLGIHPSDSPNESAEFANLWIASLITAFLPILTLFVMPLLPDAKQTESLLAEHDDACTGSIWQKYVVGLDSPPAPPEVELEEKPSSPRLFEPLEKPEV